MAKTELEVNVLREGEVEIVELDGPIDSAMFDRLKEKLDPICNKPRSRVVIDCMKLTYMNSRAIGLFVKYHRSLSLTRGRMVFCNLNPKMVRTMELLQLGKALRVYESREEALTAMAS